MSATDLHHYIVIRRDLSFGEYSAQLAHAGEAYYELARTHAMFGGAFTHNQTTCIVKGIRNEGRLRKLQGQLIAANIPFIPIVETEDPPVLGLHFVTARSLKGQLTCISIVPAAKSLVEPFVREIHTIEALDNSTETKVETLFDAIKHGDPIHQAWLKDAIEAHFAGKPVVRP